MGRREEVRPLGRSRRTWKDSIDIGWEGVDWVHLALDRDT